MMAGEQPNHDGPGGTTHQSPGGAPPRSGGSTGDNPEPTPTNGSGQTPPNHVAYDTFQKVLDEKKRAQERLDALERDQQERERKALEENEQYKTLAEQYKAELDKTKQEYVSLDTRIKDSQKVHAVLSNLDGKVEQKYWHMIDTSKVVLTDDGSVDEMSVQKAAEAFRKSYPEVIVVTSQIDVPPTPPKGDEGSAITIEKYNEMVRKGASSKDLKAAAKKLKI